MKRICLILVILLCVPAAWAADYDVTLVWEHPGATDLTGFAYRINGDNSTITVVPGGDTRSWSGIMSLNDGRNLINLRAEDEAGQVSDWCEPASYDPPPVKPVLTLILLK